MSTCNNKRRLQTFSNRQAWARFVEEMLNKTMVGRTNRIIRNRRVDSHHFECSLKDVDVWHQYRKEVQDAICGPPRSVRTRSPRLCPAIPGWPFRLMEGGWSICLFPLDKRLCTSPKKRCLLCCLRDRSLVLLVQA